MNDVQYRLFLQEQLKKKFHGKKIIKSKVKVHHKESIDREYLKKCETLEEFDEFLTRVMEETKK